MKTMLVEGTWQGSKDSWAKRDSLFRKALTSQGVELAPYWGWSTELDGIIGDNTGWVLAGKDLAQKCKKKVNIIAHSHGGQVAMYACAYGLRVNTLITVATPVRKDMRMIQQRACKNINVWIHIYTGGWDRWQIRGSIGDGYFGIVRKMPEPAKNIYIPGHGHTTFFDEPSLWEPFLELLKNSPPQQIAETG